MLQIKVFFFSLSQKPFLYFQRRFILFYSNKTCRYGLQSGILLHYKLNGTISILERFNSPNMQSCSALTMSSVARKPLPSATPANSAFVITSIPGAKTPVAKPLSNSILRQELARPSSCRLKSRTPCPHALPRLHYPRKPRLWLFWPSLSRCFCNGLSKGAICATSRSRLQGARSMVWKWICFAGQGGQNLIVLDEKHEEPGDDGSTICLWKYLALSIRI